MSQHSQDQKSSIPARRLELSLDTDGSLQTAPLSTVLLAATDDLYHDFYTMAHGELPIATAAQDEAAEASEHGASPAAAVSQSMANLSFAQRRHELAWRLVQHSQSLQHVAALTAAAGTTNLAQAAQVSSTALRHARTAWVQADEAQDALYFVHAQLFPARAAPHDVYGALDVLLDRQWYDLPNDLRLSTATDNKASTMTRTRVQRTWQLAIQRKLLQGELAWMRRNTINALWKVELLPGGGVVQLTGGGAPRRKRGHEHDDDLIYPIQALLTVLTTATSSSATSPPWTLLSLTVTVQAQTGESVHQLEPSHRQRFDLHRLAARAMSRHETSTDSTESTTPPPRPLQALFDVAHSFLLSWALQVLSAQAQALRRGVWALGDRPLVVTPVQFWDDETFTILGVVSISFWNVDDAYGPPAMGDLMTTATSNEEEQEDSHRQPNYASATNMLTLTIRAERDTGMHVALSGAQGQVHRTQMPDIVDQLVRAASDPLALSASEALACATRLCAERKANAVVQALMQPSSLLPEWMWLSVKDGAISVAARIHYHGVAVDDNDANDMPILFRLVCDSRTGSFVNTFPRSAHLLRRLACNDPQASESMSLRINSLPQNRRRVVAGAHSSGRAVREAFDGLVRSMNVLGQRTGVGGTWDDVDDRSQSLRARSIQSACADVCVSLRKCCGMAALYGLAPLGMGAAVGLEAVVDLAGDSVPTLDGLSSLLAAPPISIRLDQQLIETSTTSRDGEKKKESYLEQSLFSIVCSMEKEPTLVPLEILVKMDSPSAVIEQTGCTLLQFQQGSSKIDESSTNGDMDGPKWKRAKHEKSNGGATASSPRTEDLMVEVGRFAELLSSTINSLTT